MKKFFLKLLILALLVGAVAFALTHCGSGLGFGSGSGNESAASSFPASSSTPAESEPPKEPASSAESESSKQIVSVSVVENEYFYKNKRVTIEELLKSLAEIKENYIVSVSEDNASLQAYNKILEELKAQSIAYTEEKGK